MSMEIQVLAWNRHKNVAGLLVTLNRRTKINRNLERNKTWISIDICRGRFTFYVQ
jgi:hypothetical protein